MDKTLEFVVAAVAESFVGVVGFAFTATIRVDQAAVVMGKEVYGIALVTLFIVFLWRRWWRWQPWLRWRC